MFWRRRHKAAAVPGAVRVDKLLIAPAGPALSTVQILSSNNFEPIGRSFPYDASAGEEGVRSNVEYVRTELKRWKRSIAVLADAVSDKNKLPRVAAASTISADPSFVQSSYDILLDCLLIKLNGETASRVDALLREAFVPLAPWACTVIRSVQESADLTRNLGISLVGLAEGIKKMGPEDLSQEHRIEVQSMMGTIGRFIKQHEELQRVQNRLNAQRQRQEEKRRTDQQPANTETPAVDRRKGLKAAFRR